MANLQFAYCDTFETHRNVSLQQATIRKLQQMARNMKDRTKRNKYYTKAMDSESNLFEKQNRILNDIILKGWTSIEIEATNLE